MGPDSGQFIDTFLSDLSAEAGATRTVAIDTTEIGGHQVRYFNIPVAFDGYTYANGPTVVIAYLTLGTPPATAEGAFTKILANLQ